MKPACQGMRRKSCRLKAEHEEYSQGKETKQIGAPGSEKGGEARGKERLVMAQLACSEQAESLSAADEPLPRPCSVLTAPANDSELPGGGAGPRSLCAEPGGGSSVLPLVYSVAGKNTKATKLGELLTLPVVFFFSLSFARWRLGHLSGRQLSLGSLPWVPLPKIPPLSSWGVIFYPSPLEVVSVKNNSRWSAWTTKTKGAHCTPGERGQILSPQTMNPEEC